jgi:uncharacterized delta-60 repeat protein
MVLGALAPVATMAACDSSELVGGGTDAGSSTDAETSDVTSPRPDAAVDAGADALPDDAGDAGDAGAGASFVVHPLSADGPDRLFGVTFDATGNILATGIRASSTDPTADVETVVARFLPSGALDTTFGTNGYVSKNLAVGTNGESARGIVVQSTGKIVVAATIEHAGGDARDRDIAVARFLPDGTLDTTFGAAGVAVLDLSTGVVDGSAFRADSQWGLALAAGDKLVVSGGMVGSGRTDTDFALVRLEADGAYDATFGTGGVFSLDINNAQASARQATVLADGSVVMAGYMNQTGVVVPVLFKVTSAGVLDPSFGVNGVFSEVVLAATTEAYGAALQGTSFVTVGYGRETASDDLDWVSLRVTAGGTLDPTWGTGGKTVIDAAGFNDNGRALAVLPDNRVLLTGGGRTTSATSDAMVAILKADGQPDPTFGSNGVRLFDFGGPNDFLWAAAVSPNGKLAVAVGLMGGNTNADAGPTADDDAALLLLPLP